MKRKFNDSRDAQKNTRLDSTEDVGGEKNIVKAMVSEQNGEISCSIEETNRIRKLLGLKPLVIEKQSDESAAVNNYNAKKDQDKK